MNLKIEHVFTRVTRDAYEALIFDEAFTRALDPAAGLKQHELLAERREGGRVVRRVKVWPDQLPAAMRKTHDGELTYIEDQSFDPQRHVLTWKRTGAAFEKVGMAGEIAFEATGVRRVVTAEIKVDVFGVGRLIEKSIAKSLVETYDRMAAFTQQWIDHEATP